MPGVLLTDASSPALDWRSGIVGENALPLPLLTAPNPGSDEGLFGAGGVLWPRGCELDPFGMTRTGVKPPDDEVLPPKTAATLSLEFLYRDKGVRRLGLVLVGVGGWPLLI